jgi:integrase
VATRKHRPILAPKKTRAQDVLVEERKHLEPDELRALFDALKGDDFWEPYFRISYYWGCRVSEPALIFAEEIHDGRFVLRRLKKRERTLSNGKVENEGGFKAHSYQIPEVMAPYFEQILEWRRWTGRVSSAWLFPSTRQRAWASPGDRMAALRQNAEDPTDQAVSRMTAHRRFKKAAKEAGLPDVKDLRKTHVLRHTRGTMLFANGASIDQVQYYLGHSNPNTTQIYVHEAEALRARMEHGELSKLGLDGF